jgi:hypothetical protein
MRFPQSSTAVFILLYACCAFSQNHREEYSPRVIEFDASRIATYSNTDLIDLLSKASVEKNARGEGIYSVLPPDRREVEGPSNADPKLFVKMKLDPNATNYTLVVEQEIAKRRPYKELSFVFSATTDDVQKAWVADALDQMRGPEADLVLRPYISKSRDETTYLALKYFARACDDQALRILNQNYFKYSTSSLEWASIVRSFGECKYKPAVPHLIETVNAMMINLGYASHLALLAIYPDAKIDFRNPSETQEAWTKYVRKHG